MQKPVSIAVILAAALGFSASAKAALIYDFSAGAFGEIKFATNSFIQPNSSPIPITQFILGSLAPPNATFTQTSNFVFQNATSSLGTTATYQFNFDNLPITIGTFAPFQTVVDRTSVNGSLTISQQAAAVPEPATIAVLGSAVAGLATLRTRRRRSRLA